MEQSYSFDIQNDYITGYVSNSVYNDLFGLKLRSPLSPLAEVQLDINPIALLKDRIFLGNTSEISYFNQAKSFKEQSFYSPKAAYYSKEKNDIFGQRFKNSSSLLVNLSNSSFLNSDLQSTFDILMYNLVSLVISIS